MALTRLQAVQIRRGILLARHDDAVAHLKIRHQDNPTDITEALLEVYEDAEKILLDAGPLTRLTMKAYHKTYASITIREASRIDTPEKRAYDTLVDPTKGQNHDISHYQGGPV